MSTQYIQNLYRNISMAFLKHIKIIRNMVANIYNKGFFHDGEESL